MKAVKENIKVENFAEIEFISEPTNDFYCTVGANIVDHGQHRDVSLIIEDIENNKEISLRLWKLTQSQIDVIKDTIRIHEEAFNDNKKAC
jgi:hypothetical protein